MTALVESVTGPALAGLTPAQVESVRAAADRAARTALRERAR